MSNNSDYNPRDLYYAGRTRHQWDTLRRKYLPDNEPKTTWWLYVASLAAFAAGLAAVLTSGGLVPALEQPLRRWANATLPGLAIEGVLFLMYGVGGFVLVSVIWGLAKLVWSTMPPTLAEFARDVRLIRRRISDVGAGRLLPEEIAREAGIEEGITLGRITHEGGETTIGLDAQREGHVIVIGPPGSGKGLELTETLLRDRRSALVIDPKGEQAERTAGWRAEQFGHRIYRLPGDRFDLARYYDLTTNEDVSILHANLFRPWQEREPIFIDKARLLMKAIGVYASRTGHNPVRLLLQAAESPFTEVLAELNRMAPSETLAFSDGLDPRQAADNKFVSSSWGTYTAKMFQYTQYADVLASTAPTVPLDWEQLPATIYITYDFTRLSAAGPALSAIVAGLVRYHLRQPKIKTNFLIDEAKSVAIAGLAEYLATVRSSGISFALYLQTISQLMDAYGPDEARTILSNCRNQGWFAPGDLTTAEEMSKIYGETIDLSININQHSNPPEGWRDQPFSYSERSLPAMTAADWMGMANSRLLAVVAAPGKTIKAIVDRHENWHLFDQLPKHDYQPPAAPRARAINPFVPMVRTTVAPEEQGARPVEPAPEPKPARRDVF